MASQRLLVLAAVVLLSRGVLLQNCISAPIWVFSDADDLRRSIFQQLEGNNMGRADLAACNTTRRVGFAS